VSKVIEGHSGLGPGRFGPEPEDTIAPPRAEPAGRIERISIRPPWRQQEPYVGQENRLVAARQPKSEPATPPDRIRRRQRGGLAKESYEGPPGVQGANVGYWQAGGVTRTGAKRSKRP
jgi:hypothetical protein